MQEIKFIPEKWHKVLEELGCSELNITYDQLREWVYGNYDSVIEIEYYRGDKTWQVFIDTPYVAQWFYDGDTKVKKFSSYDEARDTGYEMMFYYLCRYSKED